jgi:hypothetical protein
MTTPRFYDPHYRLDPVIRKTLSYLDTNALERLLQHMDGMSRDHLLASLLPRQIVVEPTEGRSFSVLSRTSDPFLNELLEEMWQPFWDQEPLECLEDPHSPYPGRERALRRRLATDSQ